MEEKDQQIFDIQSQLLAMEEKKWSELDGLHYHVSTLTKKKKFLEGKNSELEKRTFVYEKKHVCLHKGIRRLETTLHYFNKNFKSSNAMIVETEGFFIDLQCDPADLVEADKGLGEKIFRNNSTFIELNRCKIIFNI